MGVFTGIARRILIASAISFACMGMVSQYAYAQEQPDQGVYEVHVAKTNGKQEISLDVAGGSQENCAGVQLWDDNETPAQRWRVNELEEGYISLENVNSGLVLDVAGGSKKEGAQVWQYESNGTDAQRWKPEESDGGSVLLSALNENLALGSREREGKKGSSMCLVARDKAITWTFERMKPAIDDGMYTLEQANSGKSLDVAGGDIENCSNIQQYETNDTMSQTFDFTYDDDSGYYTVLASASGLALDVSGGSSEDGANVWLYEPNGTFAQKWTLQVNKDGTMTLLSALSGKALDVSGGSKADCANVQIWKSNGTKAQKWSFTEAEEWIPDGLYSLVAANNTANVISVKAGSRDRGASVVTEGASASKRAQKWALVQNGEPGSYTLRNLNSRFLIEPDGSSVKSGTDAVQNSLDAGNGALFVPRIANGGIVFSFKTAPGYALDIAGGSKNAGANVQCWKDNGTLAQMFRLRSTQDVLSGQVFEIDCVDNGLAVDVAGGAKNNGAAVQLYEPNGTQAQAFRFVSVGKGTFALVNTSSKKAIQTCGKNSDQLRIWEGTSAASQQFKASLDLSDCTYRFTSNASGKRLDGENGTLSMQAENDAASQSFALVPARGASFRVYINAGHGWGSNSPGSYDPGAGGNGYEEAELNDDLAERVISIARNEYGLDVVDGRPYEVQYMERLDKAVELDCTSILSIHFDAGGGSGSMSMVGVSGRHWASLTFNEIVHEHLLAGTGLNDLGTTYRDDIYCVNGPIPAVLVEVAFIDNYYDMQVYQSRKDIVAHELAKALYECSFVDALCA